MKVHLTRRLSVFRDLKNFWEYTPLHPTPRFLPPPYYIGFVRHTTADNLKRRKLTYTPGIEVAHRDF